MQRAPWLQFAKSLCNSDKQFYMVSLTLIRADSSASLQSVQLDSSCSSDYSLIQHQSTAAVAWGNIKNEVLWLSCMSPWASCIAVDSIQSGRKHVPWHCCVAFACNSWLGSCGRASLDLAWQIWLAACNHFESSGRCGRLTLFIVAVCESHLTCISQLYTLWLIEICWCIRLADYGHHMSCMLTQWTCSWCAGLDHSNRLLAWI